MISKYLNTVVSIKQTGGNKRTEGAELFQLLHEKKYLQGGAKTLK